MPTQEDPLYTWEAVYGEDDSLAEYTLSADRSGFDHHAFAEVDLARCTAFVLHAQQDGLHDLVVKIDPASGQRPIFFRRHAFDLNFAQETATALPVMYCLGWQRTVNGKNVCHFTFIFPDGSILLSDDRNAV